MSDDDIPLTNNEAERALRGYVLWRKKRLGRCPQEWLRAVMRACIEKTDYPIPIELMSSTQSQ